MEKRGEKVYASFEAVQARLSVDLKHSSTTPLFLCLDFLSRILDGGAIIELERFSVPNRVHSFGTRSGQHTINAGHLFK